MGIRIGTGKTLIGYQTGSGPVGPNGAPSNPVLVVISDTEIDATDVMNATNADGLEWSISTDQQNWTTSTTATGVKSFTGLTAGTKYYIKTRNYKGTAFSAYSNVVNATTFGVAFAVLETTANGKYNTYSCLAQYPINKNIVVMTYLEASAHDSTYPRPLKIRISNDKGRTFAAASTLYDPGVGRVVLDCCNGYSSDGRLHLILTVADAGTSANCALIYIYSDDNGTSITSSDISAIIANATRPIFRVGQPSIIENNGILISAFYRLKSDTTQSERMVLRLVAGTWTAVSVEITSAYENEAALERLGGDNLIMIVRSEVAPLYNYIQYSSADNGLTWTRLANNLDFGVANTYSGATPSLQRFLMNGEYIIALYMPRGTTKQDMYSVYGKAADLLELGPSGWNYGTVKKQIDTADANHPVKQGSVLHYDNDYNAIASETKHHAENFPVLTEADLILYNLDSTDFAAQKIKLFGGFAADADSNAFNAVNNTNPTAINNLIGDLKACSSYTPIKAGYPLMGGSAALCKYNLVNPADTDGAFRLNFVNGAGTGWTFNANGATPDGVGAYADTFLIPNTHLTIYKQGLFVYVRTQVAEDKTDLGTGIDTAGKSPRSILQTNKVDTTTLYSCNSGTGAWIIDWVVGAAKASGLGFIGGTRTANNIIKAFRNGKQDGTTNTTTAGDLQSTLSYYLGGYHYPTGVISLATKQYAFALITNDLTDVQVYSITRCVVNFQKALNRNV